MLWSKAPSVSNSFRWLLARAAPSMWFLALIAAAAISWTIGPDDFYIGCDGKWTTTLIRNYLTFTNPGEVNSLNPVQANFSQLYPMNAWLTPGVIQFYFLPFEIAKITTMFTFLSALAVAMYALARQFGIDRLWAGIGAQCSAWFFPHFYSISGMFIVFGLNPTVIITIVLLMVLMILLLRVTAGSTLASVARIGVGATAVAGVMVYNDPMTMGLTSFCTAPCFLTAALAGSGTSQTILRRFAVLAIPALVLVVAGIAHYVLALDYYTSRYVFRTELPKTQLPMLASMLFLSRAGRYTLAITLIGLVLGSIYTTGRPRAAVWVGWTAVAFSSVAGMIYLFVDFQWWLPVPSYIQFYSFPFMIIGSAAGYAGFWQAVPEARLPAGRLRSAVHACLLLMMPAALVYGASRLSVGSEPFMERALAADTFAQDLAISPGSQWKGSVYVVFRDVRGQLTYLTLWDMGIPTHNEYSQTSTPMYFYMTYKLMHTKESKGPMFESLSIPVGPWNIGLAAAFGIRYVMLPAEAQAAGAAAADAQIRDQISDRVLSEFRIETKIPLKRIAAADGGGGFDPFSWVVYELAEPNNGQYSPTMVQMAHNEPEYRHLFSAPRFDWRRDVVLEQDPGPLTAATEGRLYVERGHLRVEANSASGRSLILLPLQYSHCLRVSGSGDPQLVRANMYFAGLLFAGNSKVRIDFDFGFFNSRCRWADWADLQRLKIPDTAAPASPTLHPMAVRRLSDIPLRLHELRDLLRDLR